MIKSILIAGAALGASVVSASAGTAFYWVGTSGSEFGAENAWRHVISEAEGTYDYVAPASFDTLEALKNSSSSAPTTGTTTGTTYSDGYDFLLGGNPDSGTADMTIAVNSYYYVNGLKASQYCTQVNYTFDFGTSGAVYTYYETYFANSVLSLKMKVDSSAVSTTENSSRALFGSYGSNYTGLTISETNLSNLSLELGDSNTFWTVSNTVYTDSTIEEFRDSSLNSPTAALFYSATDKTLSVVYAIPEPSAFGLLAGAGALALVAARRRRSRVK